MNTRKFSKENLIEELVSLFSDGLALFYPSHLRQVISTILNEGNYLMEEYSVDKELLDVLCEYELIFEIGESKYKGNVFYKYIPTEKLTSVWINVCNEVEKRSLDFVPYIRYINEFSVENNVELNELKDQVKNALLIKEYNSLPEGEFIDMLLDIGVLSFNNEFEYVEVNNSDRWYRSFLDWIKE